MIEGVPHKTGFVKPNHVAIIMDGNGRWASTRGLPRAAGHKAGLQALRRTISNSLDFGIGYLTIYAFSSENWSRPPAEVSLLMGLLRRFIRQDVAELHKSGVKIKVIGGRDDLDADIRRLLEDAEKLTAGNSRLTLLVAFNYGSKQELARAMSRIARKVACGDLPADTITPDMIDAHLDTAGMPAPDLLIRTGGEQRLSNFMLWQCAYTEFIFFNDYWPDFNAELYAKALQCYGSRDRRFGGLEARRA